MMTVDSTLWLRLAHDMRSMDDDKYGLIEDELLNLFGGTKRLFQILLANKNGINKDKMIKMSKLIEANKKNMNENENKCANILSVSDDSLNHIFTFLDDNDRLNVRLCHSVFYILEKEKEKKEICDVDFVNLSHSDLLQSDDLFVKMRKILSLSTPSALTLDVLLCLIRILRDCPFMLCHLRRHSMDDCVLHNVLKWNECNSLNVELIGCALHFLSMCKPKNKSKQLMKIVNVLSKQLKNYIGGEWKMGINKGMKVRMIKTSNVESEYNNYAPRRNSTLLVSRVITNSQHVGKKKVAKEKQHGLWIELDEAGLQRGDDFMQFDVDECEPAQDCLKIYFTALLDLLIDVKRGDDNFVIDEGLIETIDYLRNFLHWRTRFNIGHKCYELSVDFVYEDCKQSYRDDLIQVGCYYALQQKDDHHSLNKIIGILTNSGHLLQRFRFEASDSAPFTSEDAMTQTRIDMLKLIASSNEIRIRDRSMYGYILCACLEWDEMIQAKCRYRGFPRSDNRETAEQKERKLRLFINDDAHIAIIKILKKLLKEKLLEDQPFDDGKKVLTDSAVKVIIYCLLSIAVFIRLLNKIKKYANVKEECIQFIKKEILPNKDIFDVINDDYTKSDMDDDQLSAGYGYGGIVWDISSSLLKALMMIPSKEIVEFVVNKTKHSKCFSNEQSAFWMSKSNELISQAKEYLNYVLYASNIPPAKMKMILRIFAQSTQRMISTKISDECYDEFQILECIDKYGKKYLVKEDLQKLKFNLIRINDRYSFAKEEKYQKMVNVSRRILKSFFAIDGEKIVDKKYETTGNEMHIASILAPRNAPMGWQYEEDDW